MVAGMQAKGPGASAWLGAFSDEEGARYRQIFDAADFTAYQNACACQGPTEWGLAQENTFFLEFLNVRPSDTYVAEFDSVESNPDPPAGDSEALLYRRYQVFAFSADGNSTTIIAVGFANLTFTRLPTGWLITRWEDHVDPEIGAYPVNPDLLSLGRRRLESSR
jgi:hypothetical protein